jgi:anti-anti-sigma regulatory factor
VSDLHVTLAFDEGVVLAFSGELDSRVVTIVTNVLETIVYDVTPRKLVIDLRDVDAIEADAAAAIEAAHQLARRRGYRVDVRSSAAGHGYQLPARLKGA